MHPPLLREVETLSQVPPARTKLKAAAPLEIAARMLASAPTHEMTTTTVVGVLGADDVETFRSLLADISEEYGLEATLKLQVGSYSVRFNRPPNTVTH